MPKQMTIAVEGCGSGRLPAVEAGPRQSLLGSAGALRAVFDKFGDCIPDFSDGIGVEKEGGPGCDLGQARRV